jgi:hypothetical protein
MEKLRLSKMKWLAQWHTIGMWEAYFISPAMPMNVIPFLTA